MKYCGFTEEGNAIFVWAKANCPEEAFVKAEVSLFQAFGSKDPRFEKAMENLEVETERELNSRMFLQEEPY